MRCGAPPCNVSVARADAMRRAAAPQSTACEHAGGCAAKARTGSGRNSVSDGGCVRMACGSGIWIACPWTSCSWPCNSRCLVCVSVVCVCVCGHVLCAYVYVYVYVCVCVYICIYLYIYVDIYIYIYYMYVYIYIIIVQPSMLIGGPGARVHTIIQ